MKKMFKLGCGGFIVLFILAMIGAGIEDNASEPKEQKEKPKVEEQKETKKVEEPKEESKEESKKEPREEVNDLNDREFLIESQLAIFQENFKGIADVKYHEEAKAFQVFPTDPGFSIELAEILEGSRSSDDWDFLVESTVQTSESSKKILGSGYSITIMNPINSENVILLVQDGKVLYDAINEFN